MEPRFKTSFIPKKSFEQSAPIQPRNNTSAKGSLGILGMAGVVIFMMSAISVGGVYGYKFVLEASIESKATELERARELFQPALIRIMERLDMRLKSADELLANHVSMSAIFNLLENNTYTDVQFNDLNVSQDAAGQVTATMTGVARDFDVVALQSDVFATNRYILNPVFSNLDVVSEDRVSFEVRATIDRPYVLYTNRVLAGEFDEDVDDVRLPVPEPAVVPSETEADAEPQDQTSGE
jgi:hypothetical protein